MFKVKLMNQIAAAGVDVLDRAEYTASADVEEPDAILVRSADLHGMEFNEGLLCIARAGAGTNNIPLEACAARGIVVFNAPGANSEAVKELVLCAMTLASRDVLGSIEFVKSLAGRGDEIPALAEKGKNAFTGPELLGKTLGVIGLGAVGAKVANDASRLGMHVYGCDPYLSVESAWQLRTNIRRAPEYAEIYRNCDYITLHVPYSPDTHHLINRDALAQMKDGVRIINFARGEIVNDDDIVAALNSGKVKAYVTDFPSAKLIGVPGVIAMPHIGSSTPESEERCAVMAAISIRDYLENGNIHNSVNMPHASYPRNPGEPRLCVFHKNVPNVISKITSQVSSRDINIENMINASVKWHDMSYTMLDLSGYEDGLLEAVREIENVARVRLC